MKLYKLTIVPILMGVLTLGLPAEAKEYCERLYESARRDYYSLLENERKQRFHSNWDKVINKFNDIQKKNPSCSKAPDAIFNMGNLYRKLYRKSWLKSDLEKARDTFLSLEKKYPKSRLADDGLLFAAQIQEEMGKKREAYRTYDRIVSRYAGGDMASGARKKVKELVSYAPKPEQVSTSVSRLGKVSIKDIKYWSNPDYTRIVVYGTGKMVFEKHRLRSDPKAGKPPRFYIDIKNAVLPERIQNSISIEDGLLQQARIAQYDRSTVRLVLDMKSLKDSRVKALENPSRLVVDIYGEGITESKVALTGNEVSDNSPLPLSQQLGLSIRRIVLDPGHGGKDPGAVGPKGLREKDVVLALAKRVKPLLEKRGYKVLLTRNSDVFVDLKDRARFANSNKADLFISLHTNASRSRKARGMETYFLGVARDRSASETAMLENAVSEMQVLSDLEQILLDLVNAENLRHSSVLAESIQDSMYGGIKGKFGKTRNLGVKQAPFFVLVKTRMPAVLVETSFISNPSEEKLLRRNDFRDVLSEFITKGIDDYSKKVSSPNGESS